MRTKLLFLTFVIMISNYSGYSQKDDFVTTASGLKYKIHKTGNKIKPKPGDRVSVHYEGKLLNDSVFDSSYRSGKPFTFSLGSGQVIKGWDEGIALLSKGDSATLIIPPDLGYGQQQMGPIPPNSTLVFTVSLLEITPEIPVVPFNTAGKDTVKMSSGLKYIVINTVNKDAPSATPGSTVKVHYTGYFDDGRIFDSSVKRGEPISFKSGKGMVIKGWEEGISLLKKGEKARLLIPYNLAYGEAGRPPHIPAKADLIFDVELVDVIPEVKPVPFATKGKDTLTTPSGLKYIAVLEAKKESQQALAGKVVTVHYTGYFEDGNIFDSSVQRGEPFTFELGKGMVIKGWEEGISLMKKSEKFRLLIPYNLAYGDAGRPPVIPAKTNLIFDVELIDIR